MISSVQPPFAIRLRPQAYNHRIRDHNASSDHQASCIAEMGKREYGRYRKINQSDCLPAKTELSAGKSGSGFARCRRTPDRCEASRETFRKRCIRIIANDVRLYTAESETMISSPPSKSLRPEHMHNCPPCSRCVTLQAIAYSGHI